MKGGKEIFLSFLFFGGGKDHGGIVIFSEPDGFIVPCPDILLL